MEILKVIEILSWITSSTVLVALKIKYFCKYRPKVLCVYTLDGCKILSQSLDLYLEADKTAKSWRTQFKTQVLFSTTATLN